MKTVPNPSDTNQIQHTNTNINKRYNNNQLISDIPTYEQSRSKLRGKLSTSINLSNQHNLVNNIVNPL